MRMAPQRLIAAFLALSFAVSAEPMISDISLRRLSPWSGLVEVAYTLDADVVESQPGSALATIIRIQDHGTNVVERSFIPPSWRMQGTHRWIWDAVADGCQLTSTELTAQVEVVETVPANTYCVVDLQDHGVSYLSDVPAGGWSDVYKTSKLVMRLVNPGTFTMGDQVHGGECFENITITQPFYMGVFEVTRRQYAWITGASPSVDDLPPDEETLPQVNASYYGLRDDELYEHDQQVPIDEPAYCTVLADFRTATGLDFDLPTEAQWEYACRAGTESDYSNGSNWVNAVDAGGLDRLGYYNVNSSDSMRPVGGLLPNQWGLYDMHGNVQELCRDWYAEYLTEWLEADSSDPIGPPGNVDGFGYDEWRFVAKGGCWDNPAEYCTSGARYFAIGTGDEYTGFRLMCPAADSDAGEEIVRCAATSPTVTADLREYDSMQVGEVPVRVDLGPWTLVDVPTEVNWSVRLLVDGVERLTTNAVSTLEMEVAWPSNVLSLAVLVDGEPRGEPLTMTLVSTNDPNAFSWAKVLNAPALQFTAGGAGGWSHDTVTNHDGVVSMRSHDTGDDGETWVETVVEGEGTLSFWCKVSGEIYRSKNGADYYDYLSFSLDGQETEQLGSYDYEGWTNVVLQIAGSGSHTLRWSYVKDGSGAEGDDCAWLDQVSWSGAVPGGATATSTTEVPVPYAWLDQYYPGTTDYEACAKALSANGFNTVEQAYVAGFAPTSAAAGFRAFIDMANGVPKITWSPDLNENGTRSERVYTIWGSPSLSPAGWHTPTNSLDRFFKVKVQMP